MTQDTSEERGKGIGGGGKVGGEWSVEVQKIYIFFDGVVFE